MNTQITIQEVSTKLRAIRTSKSLSLSDVETLSQGRIKAVVLGSYERGARTLSVRRAIEIAELYQIPLSHLFAHEIPVELISTGQTVIDLRTINRRALDSTHTEHFRYQMLARLAQKIVRSRQDWNGEVLSLRDRDVETIGLLIDEPVSEVLKWLDGERILLKMRS